ncbi:Plancitoxin-1 [Trichinella sp. T9]|nr:Plancitoxin-1 [Trichinella sp. T9]
MLITKKILLFALFVFFTLNYCTAQTSQCQNVQGNGNRPFYINHQEKGKAKFLYRQEILGSTILILLKGLMIIHLQKHLKMLLTRRVLIIDDRPQQSAAAWIVHTVPGFPKPKATYTFPQSEYENGHLLICLTIDESQIESIAVALFVASPFIYYNDLPDAEVKIRPALKKLLNGETAIKPPFSTKQNIGTGAPASVPVQIFGKSGRSKYEIYKKIISKQLKKTIKKRQKMKANCKIPGRHILLVSSPISVDRQASNLEKDVTNWLIPDNGDIFCAVDKPYAVSQKAEPAVAICIKQANIFARFNDIAAKVDSCT